MSGRGDVMGHGRFLGVDPMDLKRVLTPPTGRVRVEFDTDAANEIDDQFALTWALLSSEQITLEAIVAAPYSFAHLRQGLVDAYHAVKQ